MNGLLPRLSGLCRLAAVTSVPPKSNIHVSAAFFKVKKNEKQKKASQVLHSASSSAQNPYVQGALKQMNDIEHILGDELTKHFSLQVDLRIYEDIIVKLEKGDEHKMSFLGRVTLKNPHMVMINFADNPSAIKWAKLSLQKSALGLNPQQEGVVLYIQTPRMTRERREQLANDAKGKILIDYKKALNEIYSQFDKKCGSESPKADEVRETRQKLLEMKKAMENRAVQLIENKRKELLKEVI